MKKKIALFLILLILSGVCAFARDIYSDSYELIYSLFANGDENEGRTTFLSVLIPAGGSAESMGTAFTAVSDDISFIELNPAGSAIQDKTQFALYHNNWISDTRIEGVAYTIRFGQLGLSAMGKWLYLPFPEYDDMAQLQTSDYYSEAMGLFNMSLLMFPGYYFYGLSLGANAKVVYRAMPDYTDNSGGMLSGLTQSAMAVMLDASIYTKFNFLKPYSSREKNCSVAIAFKNFGPPIKGEALPSVITGGISYKFIKPIVLSGDISFPINLLDISESERFYWSIGYKMMLTNFWDFHAGLLVKGGNPRLSAGVAIEMDPLCLSINYTLDLTTQMTPLNRMSIEASFQMGDLGRSEREKKADELYLLGLDAYAEGELELAAKYWEEAIKNNPNFDPAKENLNSVKKALALRQQMLDLQKLE